MTEQRLVFGEIAELYDRHRPAYPPALIDRVLGHSGLAAHAQILEVGCGTGQATRAFAERGYAITCLEPSPQMAALAHATLEGFSRVEIVVETFEDWPLPDRPFQLMVSAQAFHWVDPAQRFVKAARALRPGGLLALFAHIPVPSEGPLRQSIDRAYRECAPSIAAREPGSVQMGRPLSEDFAEAEGFGQLLSEGFPWSREWSAQDYVEMLQTQSDHAMLPAAQREALLARVGETIEEHGGSCTVHYVARLLTARRSGAPG